MRSTEGSKEVSEGGKAIRETYVGWNDDAWLANVLEERYGAMEIKPKKLMINIGSVIKIWKRLFG